MRDSTPTETGTTRRRFLATAGATTLLGVGGTGRVRAGFVPGVVGTAPTLPSRLFPTMGTDDRNPTAVVYVNLSSLASQQFVQGNFEDIVREYVLPGLLNVEVRFLAYDPAGPTTELDGGEDALPLSSRTAYGVWRLEPENFWTWFEYAFWNFTTRTYTVDRLEATLRSGGVRNYVKIPSEAADGRWESLVRATTEDAGRYGVRTPYVPTIRLLRDFKDPRVSHILDWIAVRLGRLDEGSVEVKSLLPGTKYETPYYVIDSGRRGPTAMVTGGIHGNEPEGYTTAELLTYLRPTGGRMVVLPRANRPAIEAGVRSTDDGDLNRQFPTGEPPTTRLARAIWDLVVEYDPDVVVDQHSARGVYNHDESVGQAVFPTVAGAEEAADACDLVNDLLIDGSSYPAYYDFDRGNLLDGSRALFVHKLYGERELPGYIVETTRAETAFDDCLVWEFTAARDLLWAHELFLG